VFQIPGKIILIHSFLPLLTQVVKVKENDPKNPANTEGKTETGLALSSGQIL